MQKKSLTIILVFIFFQLNAQEPKFKHITIDEGLSQSTVNAILKDYVGFLWFGTNDGLNKYDGYRFVIYRNEVAKRTTLSGNKISCLFEDSDNNLWIGTKQGGLNRYNRDYDTFIQYTYSENDSNSISSNYIKTIFEDSDKNLWIGTLGGGLNLFNKKTNKFIRLAVKQANHPLPKNITSISQADKNHLWLVGFENGLYFFDKKTQQITFYTFPPNGTSINTGKTIYKDENSTIWICSEANGLFNFNPQTKKFKHYTHTTSKNSLSHNIVKDIVKTDNGNLMLATDGGGINLFNPESETFLRYYTYDLTNKNTLNSNAVYTIYKDGKRYWIGTFNGGVNIIDPYNYKFKTYRPEISKNSLSYKSVISLANDYQQNIWIGTDGGGLNLFDRKKNHFIHFKNDPKNSNSISSDVITSIYEDSDKNLWIGTFGKGLNLFDRKNNQFIRYKHNENDAASIPSNTIWTIYEDSQKNLWLGTLSDGLILFKKDRKQFIHYIKEPSNENILNTGLKRITYIYEDKKGNLWLGGDGLTLFDRKKEEIIESYKQDFNNPNTLSNNDIRTIYEDTKNRFWIGTEGGGLNLFDRQTKQFKIYTTKDGLPSNSLHDILEDERGNLWISSNKGICKFNPDSMTFRNYDVNDGLQSNEFSFSASLKLPSGEMLFGGVNGVNIFYPDSIIDNKNPPPIVFTDFKIFNHSAKIGGKKSPLKKHISQTKQITLTHKQAFFSIEFAALNYTAGNKNEYAYQLKGFSDKWHHIGHQRSATYTNLDAGEYTFTVIASNNDGVWNNEGISLKIKILPPFWKTAWFISLVLFIIISIVTIIIRTRFARIKKQKIQLEEEVKKRTAEIRKQNKELEKLSLVASKTTNAIAITNEKGDFEWINQSFTKTFGYTLDDLHNIKGKNMIGELTENKVKQQIQEAIKNKKAINYEYLSPTALGKKIWLQVSLTPILNQKNELTKLIIVDTDISKIKQAEQKNKKQKEEIEKAYKNMQLISEFGQNLTSHLNFDTINDIIYDYISSLMDTSAFGIGIYKERNQIIEFQKFKENGENLPYFYTPITEKNSLAVHCVKNKQEIIINNLDDYKKFIQGEFIKKTSKIPHSVIYLPLIIQEKPVGVITVQSYADNAYKANDITILGTIASYIAIAIENSRVYNIVQLKNTHIQNSMDYARTIQEAILPMQADLQRYLNAFILFRPKDIVSGDFYFMTYIPAADASRLKLFVAVVDCTGHGVPGAFMSMIGYSLLNEIIKEKKIYTPSMILENVNLGIRKILKQDKTDNDDGMDVCLCLLEKEKHKTKVTFAGAKRPLIFYRKKTKQIETIKGARRTLGGLIDDNIKRIKFTNHILHLEQGDMFYLTSDGIADQSSPCRKRFGSTKLINVFTRIAEKNIEEQQQELEKELDKHQNKAEQRDDITVFGIKI